MSPSLGPDPEQRVLSLVDQRVREMLRENVASTDISPRSFPLDRVALSSQKGSIPYDNGKQAMWLPPGASKSMMTVDANGLPNWVPRYGVGRMYLNASQVFNGGIETLVNPNWITEFASDTSVVQPTPGSAVIFARRTGWFRVNYGAMFTPTTTTLNGYITIKNSSGVYLGVLPFQNVGGYYQPGNAASTVFSMAAGDWVALYVYAYWGVAGTWTILGGARYNTFIEMEYLGDI